MFTKLLKSATKQAARYQNSEMPTDKTRHGVKWYTSPLQHHRAPRRSNQPVLSCQFKGKSWEVSAYITNRCSREGWDQHNVWKSAQRWKQQNPIFKIFIPTSWIHSGRVYYHIQGWKSHPLDSWQKCSQAYKKKRSWFLSFMATCGCLCMYTCKCAFVFACLCLRFQAGLADNKWKCSPVHCSV